MTGQEKLLSGVVGRGSEWVGGGGGRGWGGVNVQKCAGVARLQTAAA